MTRLMPAITLAITFLAAAAGFRYAESAGLIGPDVAQRVVQAMIGIMLAGFANMMPKRLGGRRYSPEAEARLQLARRVGGWSLTLAGLAHAAIWAFAPIDAASLAAMAVVGSALGLTVGFAVWACTRLGKGSPAGTASGS